MGRFFVELTGGTKQTGTRTVNNSKDMSVINTTATLVIRQADEDDDDDDDEGRRELHDILPHPETDSGAAVDESPASTSSSQEEPRQQQSGRSSIINNIMTAEPSNDQSEENIPLAKRLKMSWYKSKCHFPL